MLELLECKIIDSVGYTNYYIEIAIQTWNQCMGGLVHYIMSYTQTDQKIEKLLSKQNISL